MVARWRYAISGLRRNGFAKGTPHDGECPGLPGVTSTVLFGEATNPSNGF